MNGSNKEGNPITFVRQSAMRKVTPSVLEPQEIQALMSELEQPFRLMVHSMSLLDSMGAWMTEFDFLLDTRGLD